MSIQDLLENGECLLIWSPVRAQMMVGKIVSMNDIPIEGSLLQKARNINSPK